MTQNLQILKLLYEKLFIKSILIKDGENCAYIILTSMLIKRKTTLLTFKNDNRYIQNSEMSRKNVKFVGLIRFSSLV